MIIPKRKIDRASIEMANSIAISRMHLAKLLVKDPSKESRLEKQLCIPCNYSQRVGGASITYTKCGICSQEMNFPSTSVDVICKDCAIKNNLCKCCGADINLKNRLKQG